MCTRLLTPTAVILAALLCTSCAGVARDKDHEERQAAASDHGGQAAPNAAAQAARPSLVDGASSVDALMDAFLQALANKDKDALVKLRVNKAEYVDLIIPGTVPVGQPPRQVSEQPREYYWSLLDTKSRYYADEIVGTFGGRAYRSHKFKFSQPTKEYAWYTAHGEVRMELEGDDDQTYHLLTGWVAEVDGKYKFIGYEYRD